MYEFIGNGFLSTALNIKEDLITGLVLLFVAWVKAKPFLSSMVKEIRQEMCEHMESVKKEITEISKSVNKLTALEHLRDKQISNIESRLLTIEIQKKED